MFLTAYRPRTVLKEFDNFLDNFSLLSRMLEPTSEGTNYYSQRNKDDYELAFKVPGFSKDEIKISCSDGILTITGKKQEKEFESKKKRFEEEFEQSVTLPTDVDAEKISAKLENGILTLKIPFKGIAQAKQIEIK